MTTQHSNPGSSALRIGDCVVRPQSGSVVRPDGEHRLEPRVMQVLVTLSQRPGEVSSRRDLMDAVWPNQVVRDDVLSRCISQIRKALGPDSIVTVPKIGYRLALTVVQAPKRATNQPDDPGPEITLAVLPFANYSTDESRAFFADGLTEQLIAALARIGDIRVISRTSAMVFKGSSVPLRDVSEQLGANRIVEGSVSFDGEDVRVTVQLIDATSDAHLWADSYHRHFSDLLTLQDEIVRMISATLQRKLSTDALPPVSGRKIDRAALELILRANHFNSLRTLDAFRKAKELLTEAVAIDPEYALAWGVLADVNKLLVLYGGESPTTLVDEIYANADRAFELDNRLASARYTKATTYAAYERDYQRAYEMFEATREIAPPRSMNLVGYGNTLWALGRGEDAMLQVREAQREDPLNPGIRMNVADYLMLSREYEDAIAQLDDLLDLNENLIAARERRARIFGLLGATDRALADLDRIRRIVGHDGWNGLGAALILALANRPDEARALVDARVTAGGYVDPLDIARIHAVTGDQPEALRWLERAYVNHSFGLNFFAASPYFDTLRSTPEYSALRQRHAVEPR